MRTPAQIVVISAGRGAAKGNNGGPGGQFAHQRRAVTQIQSTVSASTYQHPHGSQRVPGHQCGTGSSGQAGQCSADIRHRPQRQILQRQGLEQSHGGC